MVIFYKKWKKYNEIQLTKKRKLLKYSKNDKSSYYIVMPAEAAIAQLSGVPG